MKIIVNRKEKRAETAAVGALPRRLQAASEGEKRGFFERFGRRTLDFPARFFYNRRIDDAISAAAPSGIAVIRRKLRS